MDLDVDYYIDGISATAVRGWAWNPERPESPVTVALVSDAGEVLAQAVADGHRGDLAAHGKRGGRCAFHLPLAFDLATGTYRLRAVQGAASREIGRAFRHESPETAAAMSAQSDTSLSDGAGARGHLDEAGPYAFSGWIHGGRPFAALRRLDLLADGEVVASALPDRWRNDVEDHFQGDGRVGFALPFPPHLLDGEMHRFDLRWPGETTSLLREPIRLRTSAEPPPALPAATPAAPAPDAPIELSIIVNFYNMHREAERTLTSLSRRFQRDIADLSYEVLCIDNGSTPAMTEESITRHGPEFRLFRPAMLHPSPIFALNEAAAAARGRTLAVMIDGAHLLSPGVLAEAMAAMRAETRAMVAVRHWFVGGDQRWLSAIGYSREHEDLPFAKIDWPNCGYDIFNISVPIFDSPNTWFDGMSESNCLFLCAADFAALGGFDPGFDMPGAGFANLDLFARASHLPGMTVVALIGEASFHQYHEGTTTNVTDAEKENRVRRYSAAFETLRGHVYEPVDKSRIKFRGAIRSDFAMNARQRPSGRVRLGLTAAVRPIPASRSFEEGARDYASTAYVESGGPQRAIWAGQGTGVAPADLLELQQVLWNERPDVLVMKDVAPGLVGFVRSILPAIQLKGLTLLWVTHDGQGPTPAGVRRILGDMEDPVVSGALDEQIGAAEAVCVLFQPRRDEPHPVDGLHRYARLVTAGDYMVVLGAALGQPGIAYSMRWTSNAIHRFIDQSRDFVIDRTMNAHFVTTCPSGFLRRLANTRGGQPYDGGLDILEGV